MKYEYKIQPVSPGSDVQNPSDVVEDAEFLNRLGSDGWELVSVVPSLVEYHNYGKCYLYFLRRPKTGLN